MLTHTSIYPIDISAGSAAIPAGAQNYSYLITGSKNFTGSAVTITMSGTVPANSVRMFYVDITPTNYDTTAGDHLTILGTVIPNAILQNDGKFLAIAVYSSAAWKVFMYPSWDSIDFITNGQIADLAVDTENLAAGAVETAKVAAGAIDTTALGNNSVTVGKMSQMAANGIIGNNTGGAANPIHLTVAQARALLPIDITVSGTDIQASGTYDSATGMLTIADASIVASSVGHSELDSEARIEMMVIHLSLEAGALGKQYFEIPYPCTLIKAHATVASLLAATDATITLLNNAAAAMGSGVITVAGASAIGTNIAGLTVSPSSNNTFIAGDDLQIATAKVTPGGQVNVVLHFQRT